MRVGGNAKDYELYEERDSLMELTEKLNKEPKGNNREFGTQNEIVIPSTIPIPMIRGFVCKTQKAKEELIERLRKERLITSENTINGKPIDQFIYCSDRFSQEMWES